MNSRLLNLTFSIAVTVCFAADGQSTDQRPRQRARSIEFSAPKNDSGSTNLNQLGSKKNSLKELEEDLFGPLQSLQPRGSLDGVIAPPAIRPPVNALSPAQ